jgi:WhiB family transcriptional regulator, redox-sensing transcriptional regulator
MISADTEMVRHLKQYDADEWQWMAEAHCRYADPEIFYAVNGKFNTPEIKNAIRICRECPVIKECLNWALKTGDGYGVLGGMTPAQRTRYHREMEYLKSLRRAR